MWKESQGFCEHMLILISLDHLLCNGMRLEPSNSLPSPRAGKQEVAEGQAPSLRGSWHFTIWQGPSGICLEGPTEESGSCSPRFFDIFLNCSRQLQKTETPQAFQTKSDKKDFFPRIARIYCSGHHSVDNMLCATAQQNRLLCCGVRFSFHPPPPWLLTDTNLFS